MIPRNLLLGLLLTGVSTGADYRTYRVAEVTKKGWTQTSPPAPGTHAVNVTAGAIATGIDFGNEPRPAASHGAK